MKFVRIKLYVDGEWTTFEELYLGDDIVRAVERFMRAYPQSTELKINIIEEDPDNPSEYFKMAMSCGCVH